MIYRLASLAVFRWMFSPGVVLIIDKYFSGLLAIWYVFFCAFLAGMY